MKKLYNLREREREIELDITNSGRKTKQDKWIDCHRNIAFANKNLLTLSKAIKNTPTQMTGNLFRYSLHPHIDAITNTFILLKCGMCDNHTWMYHQSMWAYIPT